MAEFGIHTYTPYPMLLQMTVVDFIEYCELAAEALSKRHNENT